MTRPPVRVMDLDTYIACHDCDLLHRRQTMPTVGVATCSRCGAVLYRNRRNSLDRTLAMAVCGVILFVIANLFPFLTLSFEGQVQETTLVTGIMELYRQGMTSLAVLVLATGVVFPLVELAGLIYLLLPLKFDRKPWGMAVVFRVVRSLQPWGMTEVFLLGISGLHRQVGQYGFGNSRCGPVCVFGIDLCGGGHRRIIESGYCMGTLDDRDIETALLPLTAEKAGMVGCHTCGLLSRRLSEEEHAHSLCPRCGARLHHRKPNSLARTWALVIAALVLYIPANALPVMQTTYLGKTHADTILSGVFYFVRTGSWHLALIIFVASVVVPALKLLVLTYLLISVQLRSDRHPPRAHPPLPDYRGNRPLVHGGYLCGDRHGGAA